MAIDVTALVFVPLKLAFITALFVTVPILTFQLAKFISPGLYINEKKIFFKFTIFSIALFNLGLCFGYLIAIPCLLKFFILLTPDYIKLMPDISYLISFILRMLLLFGLCFELPMVMLILVKTNLITQDLFKVYRPYAVVGAFSLGMIFTPPDVLSQIMVALPLWLLYELGIILTKHATKR